MMSEKMEKALNEQIRKELFSEYYYLAMAAYCESIDMPGCAHWMLKQSTEEHEHAMRIYNFVNDRNGRVRFDAIEKPKGEFKSILDMFEHAFEHEKFVTKSINELYELALKENDYPAQIELQWFIEEQVEEEKTANEIIQRLKQVGDNPSALFMLDQKMGQRSGTDE